MVKKKKRRRRKFKYVKSSGKSLVPIETPEQLRAKFPAELVNAFIRVKKTKFEDEKVYRKYAKLSRKYLGDKADDKIEFGRLVVLLSKATVNMLDKKKTKNKKDIFEFFKKPEALTCKQHSKYGAIRKPRKACKDCWDMYNEKRKTK